MNIDLAKRNKLKIIQITDTHLYSSNNTIVEIKNNKNFYNVISKIKDHDLMGTDLIFLTGDLSQDETTQSYKLIADEFSNIDIPVYWIPGNHDNLDHMFEVFSSYPLFHYEKHLRLKYWTFLFLNTKKNNSESGFLNTEMLTFLKNETINTNKNICIVMHHHPTPFHTPLIDEYVLENRVEFWSVLEKSSVKMIICGHVHGDYSFFIKNTHIESAPATCFQFKKGASFLELENNIGYKVHYFDYNTVNSESKIWVEPDHEVTRII